jgi:hypothetical protein
MPPRGLSQHRAAQRHASNQASDEQGPLGTPGRHPSMTANVTRGVQKVASRVMEIGEPQWLAKKWGNVH